MLGRFREDSDDLGSAFRRTDGSKHETTAADRNIMTVPARNGLERSSRSGCFEQLPRRHGRTAVSSVSGS